MEALSLLVACHVRRNWPDGPATSMRVPPSVVEFLDVTVPLLARASVNGVSTVKAKDDEVERGQLSASVVSAPSRRSGTIRLSDKTLSFTHCTTCAGNETAALRIEVEVFVGRLSFVRRIVFGRWLRIVGFGELRVALKDRADKAERDIDRAVGKKMNGDVELSARRVGRGFGHRS